MSDKHGQSLGRVKHIHFVGIGGAGMSGIAEVLHNLGYNVSGTDMIESEVITRLKSLGIKIDNEHLPEHIQDSDVVVYSSAVSENNPELEEARARRVPIIPRAEMLSELMRFKHGIAVAGTHGKTTTTSLIASVLAEGGLDPTYVVGGLLNRSGSHARLGKSQYLVAEADESDASFLHLQPIVAVLTNVDADHLDNYAGDFFQLQRNFLEFIQNLPFYGLAVVCMDDKGNRGLLDQITKPVLTYGVDYEADINARIISHEKNRTLFSVSRKHQPEWIQVELNLPGKHNVLNALAAIAVGHELGVSEEAIIKALENFEGIARRCQLLGTIAISGTRAILIDDYAHHPSEIAATLKAIREGWPDRRLLVIFQPHRYSRLRDLFEDFVQVLSSVDVLLLLETYSAGEQPLPGADTRSLCRAIRLRGQVDPIFVDDKQDCPRIIKGIMKDGDILLVLGAGDVGKVASTLRSKYGEADACV